ncbi:hypothetical protein Ddye_030168 [Dipteronia dyeriana]|uniref:Uncharacterized protein n=1 Tax=Dipteronia dyeriana TaxID=168575 RepID=A0AAD9TGK1_9ROSI|nr:hypothetical protein Ddye_030168 [Dipteronia dyeriana]
MKINGEDAANMATKKSRVDDDGLIVKEVDHNFVDVSSKDDKSISKANKKMKSFSPTMSVNSQNHDEQLIRNMVAGIQKETDLLFPPSLFDSKCMDKPLKLDSRTISILVDESDHDYHNDVLLDNNYNIGRNLMEIRKTNQRKPSRYKLSPYDKCRRQTKNKFKVRPFEVSNPVSESDLKLIQFIFDPNLNQREILVDAGHVYLNRQNFCSLLPSTWIDGFWLRETILTDFPFAILFAIIALLYSVL